MSVLLIFHVWSVLSRFKDMLMHLLWLITYNQIIYRYWCVRPTRVDQVSTLHCWRVDCLVPGCSPTCHGLWWHPLRDWWTNPAGSPRLVGQHHPQAQHRSQPRASESHRGLSRRRSLSQINTKGAIISPLDVGGSTYETWSPQTNMFMARRRQKLRFN